MMKMVDDFRWKLRQKEYVPIMTGGMGVDISTAALALESARLGGIGHISDAMVPTVSDRRYETNFVQQIYVYRLKSIASRSILIICLFLFLSSRFTLVTNVCLQNIHFD